MKILRIEILVQLYILLEIKPCRLGPRIQDFDTEQKSNSFNLCHCVWLCLIVWFTLTLNFWYLKLKKHLIFFLRLEAVFFGPILSLTRHLQQIHWIENFCRMYGLAVIASVSRLNICQILMRLHCKPTFITAISNIIHIKVCRHVPCFQ